LIGTSMKDMGEEQEVWKNEREAKQEKRI